MCNVCACCCHVQLFVTLWTVASQASLLMESSSKNTAVSYHFLLQRNFQSHWTTWEAHIYIYYIDILCICVCVCVILT